MLNRRGFLSSSLAVSASLTLPQSLWAQLASLPGKLPDRSQYDSNEDAYWREMRKQFLIPTDEVYLNNGTVGSSPAPDGFSTSAWRARCCGPPSSSPT